MSDAISSYQDRLLQMGKTKRDRIIRKGRYDLTRLMPDIPSYHKVTINGRQQYISILSSDDLYEKKIHSLPGEKFYCGEIITWKNTAGAESKWIISEIDFDDTMQLQANIARCNYVLKWYDENGELITRDCVVIDGTKYIIGETEKRQMTTGSARVALWLPHDKDTEKIHRGMRFLIDNSSIDPLCYELTKPNRISNVYDGHGIYKHILSECASNPKEDLYVDKITGVYNDASYGTLIESDLDGEWL